MKLSLLCPTCKHPLEELLTTDTMKPCGEYGCFSTYCKYPDTRWIRYGVMWERLSEEKVLERF